MKFFATTDVGCVRSHNEDSYYASDACNGALPNLFIVADGMGGENAGDYASNKAVEYILEKIDLTTKKEPVAILEQAVSYANAILYDEANRDVNKRGMGTTVVAATYIDGHLYIANVGDSRLYILSEELHQITKDHSVVEELVRSGELTKSEAKKHPKKHMLTRAVGVSKSIKIDLFDVTLSGNERVVMCTDGLTNMISDDAIKIALESKKSTKYTANALIEAAKENGGKDNITAIVIDSFQ